MLSCADCPFGGRSFAAGPAFHRNAGGAEIDQSFAAIAGLGMRHTAQSTRNLGVVAVGRPLLLAARSNTASASRLRPTIASAVA